MRKLKLQMQLSVDGYSSGVNGKMDWIMWNWDDELKNYINELTDTTDLILLGKNLAQGFIPHWAAVASNPDDPSYTFGKIMHQTKKVVFTNTLENTGWENTAVVKSNFIDYINLLKKDGGKDIIVYGGISFVSSLIEADLIDEYHLFINPVAIGKGLSIFNNLTDKHKFSLIKSVSFSCGIVLLNYAPDDK